MTHPDMTGPVWDAIQLEEDVRVERMEEQDVLRLLDVIGLFRQEENLRRIALKILHFWVKSEQSHGPFSSAFMARAIDALSTAANAVDDSASRLEIASIMKLLVRQLSPKTAQHAISWMWPLLCFAADGIGSNDYRLVNESLEAFSSCIERGVSPHAELIDTAALPLLYSIAKEVPGHWDVGIRIANCIRALAQNDAFIGQTQRITWAELFLEWLINLDHRQNGVWEKPLKEHEKDLAAAAVGALSAMSSMKGVKGKQIAHTWLAEMIFHLSKTVKPYRELHSVLQHSGNIQDGPQKSSSWRSWIPFLSSKEVVNDENVAIPENVTQEQLDLEEKEAEAKAVADIAEQMLGPAAAENLPAEIPKDKKSQDSWWRYFSFRGGRNDDGLDIDERISNDGAVQASDPELSLFINAAPIGPHYARSVAIRLLEASGKVVNSTDELSQSVEDSLPPTTAATYNAIAATINIEVADKVMYQALKVLSALVANDKSNRAWMLSAGAPQLLQQLMINRDKPEEQDDNESNEAISWSNFGSIKYIPVPVQRQVSRLLAIMSIENSGAEAIAHSGWVPWLQHLAASADCKVSSNAARALLHVEASQRSGLLVPGVRERDLLNTARALTTEKGVHQEVKDSQSHVQQSQNLLRGNQSFYPIRKRKESRWTEVGEDDRLVLHDGIHLFAPLSHHHEVLAQCGTADHSPQAPDIDIIFLHGIRGGAFITWRFEGSLQRGKAQGNLDHSICWPTAWLAPEFPSSRIISAEYAAPASGWEGESLPLYATANHLAEKLVAAGVGNRPVVFICHSMGGLIAKEIIGRGSMKDAGPALQKISSSTIGAVFYSVPHAGSPLADFGWRLRFIGAAPSRAVAHLKTGPHLESINEKVRDLCRRGALSVLSFSEGQPTKVSYVTAHIVPHESAYPGYGDFVVLEKHDHISACKPKDKGDPSYANVVEFLRKMRDKVVTF